MGANPWVASQFILTGRDTPFMDSRPMKPSDLLDQARSRSRLPSDYAVAKRLDVSTQVVGHWRHNRKHPGLLDIFRLAELAGRNPAEVIAEIEQERQLQAGRIDQAEGWRQTLQRLASVAAGVAVVSICSAPAPSIAAGHATQFSGQPLYIMFNRRRFAWCPGSSPRAKNDPPFNRKRPPADNQVINYR